jgi:hypothetical protein
MLRTPVLAAAALLAGFSCAAQTPPSSNAPANTPAAGADIQLVSPKPASIAIDKAGNGAISLLLKGKPGVPLTAALIAVTDFRHGHGDSGYFLNSQATITGVPATIPANGLFTVKIVVAQVWETGDSEAELRNGDSVSANSQRAASRCPSESRSRVRTRW